MPPTGLSSSSSVRTLEEIVASAGGYSIEAFYFIQEGIQFAAERIHGPHPRVPSKASRHITGQQLCDGLRELALARWGIMAGAVLGVWGVTQTLDFGRIVFALIEAGMFQKTASDSLADFADVYDFRNAFGKDYAIRPPATLA